MSDRYEILIVGGGAAGFTAGIYAARDRCRALLVQLVSSAGDGATAALAAIRYLRTGRWDA